MKKLLYLHLQYRDFIKEISTECYKSLKSTLTFKIPALFSAAVIFPLAFFRAKW